MTDAKFLHDDYGVQVEETLDLRYMAAMAGYLPEGLAEMSKSCLNVNLNKNEYRCSNWGTPNISEGQINYAADDAFASIELFDFFYDELDAEEFFDDVIGRYCREFLNCHYNHSRGMEIYKKKCVSDDELRRLELGI